MVERGPSAGPRRSRRRTGASGMLMPGQNSARPAPGVSAVIFRWPSGNSSARSPNPGIEAVQPHVAGSNSSRSTCSVSPASAPSIATGPVTWSTWSKMSVSSEAVVESAVIWPFDASRQSNSTTVPDATLATGGIAGSQARWF